jgi:outer membrane protein TolC
MIGVRKRAVLLCALLTCVTGPRPAAAQHPATLSLEEALVLARQNNPGYLATRNDDEVAAWGVREAYGGLLPSASVAGGMRYEEGGSALFGSLTAADIGVTETPSYYFSSYSASATWRLSPQTWFNVSEQRASRRAVAANVVAAETSLENAVKRSYVGVLRARDMV